MRLVVAVILATVLALPASAQPVGGSPPRGELEAELRRGYARVVRERVGLSDDQMRKLAPIAQRIGRERARIQLDEREARIALGRILRDSVPPDSARVEQLLGRLIEVQKRRVSLLEQEQKELAAIMSPVQRARFLGLQEQLRRQMEERRRSRGQAQGGPPPRRGARPN